MDETDRRLPEGFREVGLSPERHAEVLELDVWAFPSSREPDDLLAEGSPLSWDRARGIEADGRPGLVGMRASYPFGRFPVPGGTLPVAGLTWVGVHPGYRRRGLLGGMIAGHFADCAARGEAVSALTASEPAIYGRFGYGLASRVLSLTLPRRARLREVPGSAGIEVGFERFGERHVDLVADLHARAWPLPLNRPGWVSRETPQLAVYLHADPPAERDGNEAMRILVARRDGQPSGYALFRRKSAWRDGVAEGEVGIRELVALDAATRHALLSRLLDLDLTSTVRAWCLPVDDPLTDLLVDLRATRPRLGDKHLGAAAPPAHGAGGPALRGRDRRGARRHRRARARQCGHLAAARRALLGGRRGEPYRRAGRREPRRPGTGGAVPGRRLGARAGRRRPAGRAGRGARTAAGGLRLAARPGEQLDLLGSLAAPPAAREGRDVTRKCATLPLLR